MAARDESPVRGAIAKHDAHVLPATTAVEGGHVLCLEDTRSWVFPLPVAGEVTIGREREATLRIEDPLASRAHAQLSVDRDVVRITDLKSKHGTLIGGHPLVGARVLHSGDSVCVGSAQLFVQRPPSRGALRVCYGPAGIAHRLDEELERALHHRYEVAVLVVLGHAALDHAVAADIAQRTLRPLDVIAFLAERELAVVLPDVELDEAGEVAAQLRALLPGARVGIAVSPADGADAGTLLGWAHTAAAAGDGIAHARESCTRLRVESRDAVVAEPAMVGTYELLRRLAPRTRPLAILGEPGVGKELAARALHALSPRAEQPFVVLAGGSATGASLAQDLDRARAGATLFVAEVSQLTPELQAELARALRGGELPVIASTVHELERLGPELRQRFAANHLVIPPLRWRPRDVAALVRTLSPARLSIAAHYALLRHAWPGNVPELEAALVHAAAARDADAELDVHHLPPSIAGEPHHKGTFRPIDDEVRDLERTRMLEALAATGGVRNRAAELIRMPLRTFVTKLKRYSITRGDW